MKAAFYTLGCKVNQYETQILIDQFYKQGFEIVTDGDIADVYVVNSCTVTASGDKKTRQALHRFKRQNPAACVVLTGCFPQAFPEEAKAILQADVITGSYNRASVCKDVLTFLQNGQRIVDITPHQAGENFEPMRASRFLERTRAFVKIEDGCDHFCAYCIIPKARGPIRSKKIDELTQELSLLNQQGYREVVLAGINLASYGKDLGLSLADAVEAAAQFENIQRIRLGSVEPELMTRPLLERLANIPKFCTQFHLSLQSGCDATLARMRRRYNTSQYQAVVDTCRELFVNPSITTDMMTGFPGETEEEFLQSLAFVHQIGFAKVHAFSYSIRPGTLAATMPNQVPKAVKEERTARLIAAAQQAREGFLLTQKGLIEPVLFETQDPQTGLFEGYTPNYTPVYVSSSTDLRGKICRATLGDVYLDGVQGCI